MNRTTATIRSAALLFALVVLTAGVFPAAPPAGHSDIVYAVAVSPDSKQLVSASEDNTAVLWDATKLTPQLTLKHTAPVYDVAITRDGKEVVTADGEGNITIWEPATGKQLRKW
jgi:WD40 repeat protein